MFFKTISISLIFCPTRPDSRSIRLDDELFDKVAIIYSLNALKFNNLKGNRHSNVLFLSGIANDFFEVIEIEYITSIRVDVVKG